MTRREIAALAFQLLALAISVYAIILLVPFAARAVKEFGHGRFWFNADYHSSSLIASGVCFGIAWWIRAHCFDYADRTFDETESPETAINLREEDLGSVGSASLGFIVVVQALSDFFAEIAFQYAFSVEAAAANDQSSATLAVMCTKAAFGFWLMFGSRTTARFIVKTRIDRSGIATSEANVGSGEESHS